MPPIYKNILRYTNETWDAKPWSIREFLSDNYLRIPEYQRPYSWEDSHVEALIKDILNIKISGNEDSQWFIGCFYTSSNTDGRGELMLLDGQQRFTTIYLLIIELIDILILTGIDNQSYKNGCNESIEQLSYYLYNSGNSKVRMELVQEVKQSWHALLKAAFKAKKATPTDKKILSDAIDTFKGEAYTIFNRTGVKTGITITKNLTLIKNRFKLEFTVDGNYDFEKIFRFKEDLLNRLWMIEIPLNNNSSSISIFEGLNNRGKALTLSDKIIFKAVRQVSYPENKTAVRSKLYKTLSRLDKLKKYVTEDQFWKHFIMSENAKSYTREDYTLSAYAKLFEVQCDLTDAEKEIETSGVFQLLSQISGVLDALECISNHNSTEYLDLFTGSVREKHKILALLKTADKALIFRDMNCVLVMHLCKNHQPTFEESGERKIDRNFLNGLFNLIRFSYLFAAFTSKPSNDYRNAILNSVRAESSMINSNLWVFMRKTVKDEEIKESPRITAESLINHDRSQDLFTIYLYMLLSNFTELSKLDFISHKHQTVEHIFPQSWKKYWKDLEFEKNDLVEQAEYYLQEIPEDERDGSPTQQIQRAIISLDNYVGTKNIPDKESSGVELIGNKVAIDNETNSAASNYDLTVKKEKYSNTSTILPKRISNVKVEELDSWTHKNIIKRTIQINNLIWNELFENPISFDGISDEN